MNDMEFEGWKLSLVGGRFGPAQIECRKTIGEMCRFDDRTINVCGQVLLVVALDGWKRKKESGSTDVRLSMNNPCPMSFDELAGLGRVAEYAREMLINLALENKSLEQVTKMIKSYYREAPDHAWPILLGVAGTIDGVEQFIIYPKVVGAIRQMQELFKKVGNVDVKDEVIGEFIAEPAR